MDVRQQVNFLQVRFGYNDRTMPAQIVDAHRQGTSLRRLREMRGDSLRRGVEQGRGGSDNRVVSAGLSRRLCIIDNPRHRVIGNLGRNLQFAASCPHGAAHQPLTFPIGQPRTFATSSRQEYAINAITHGRLNQSFDRLLIDPKVGRQRRGQSGPNFYGRKCRHHTFQNISPAFRLAKSTGKQL